MKPPTPPAAESAPTPVPLFAYFDPATGDDCGWIAIYRNDDTPTASLVSRLIDTPANRQYAAFIVKAVNAHAAQQRIVELQAALELVVEQDDRSGMAQLIRETDGDARTEYDEYYLGALDAARLALRHPERT